MSIIEEALRRVQDPLLPPATPSPAPAPNRPAAPEHPPATPPWQGAPTRPAIPTFQPQMAPLTAVALAVLLLTAALIIGGAFWMGRVLTATPTATPRDDTPPVQASVTPPTPTLEAKPANPPLASSAHHANASGTGLVLSGVVEGLGDPYAVINGMIVGVGERVGNVTLEQIAQGSVKLRHDDGRQTTLRVPR